MSDRSNFEQIMLYICFKRKKTAKNVDNKFKISVKLKVINSWKIANFSI